MNRKFTQCCIKLYLQELFFVSFCLLKEIRNKTIQSANIRAQEWRKSLDYFLCWAPSAETKGVLWEKSMTWVKYNAIREGWGCGLVEITLLKRYVLYLPDQIPFKNEAQYGQIL